ncbi:MAG TPA: arylsulfatase [Sedimentisphaerales bacterium]|nr:arylsulfatase [Sedimentisphaerales bacterium]
MQRRDFLKTTVLGAAAGLPFLCAEMGSAATAKRPNVVFILADDLGYADLGCYGQKKIKTPNLDRLAAEGMRFTQAYSGNPVCAPSRCTLMTGYHTGHAQVRNNKQVGEGDAWALDSTTSGQWPLAEGTFTVGHLFQKAGYTTGAFGKWGLGRVGTTGDPQKQGFDQFFGYICQRQAHTFYPNHLWRDGEILRIEENKDGAERVYSHDVISEAALQFIRTNKGKPFFLYLPSTIPHVALQVPEDSLAEYKDHWPDPPYDGKRGYVPHEHPRACYAGMVTRLDREVGRIMALLKELGLDDSTLVIFASDNGPTYAGGSDAGFFESASPLRGLKGSVWEGGIRVPFIARRPGRIQPGTKSDHIHAFWDFLPTCAELLGEQPPTGIDGVSVLPTLLGRPEQQKKHGYLYWELDSQQAVRMDDWKAVRLKPAQKIQLFNLKTDLGEQKDVAAEHPDLVARFEEILVSGRTDSEVFPLTR